MGPGLTGQGWGPAPPLASWVTVGGRRLKTPPPHEVPDPGYCTKPEPGAAAEGLCTWP